MHLPIKKLDKIVKAKFYFCIVKYAVTLLVLTLTSGYASAQTIQTIIFKPRIVYQLVSGDMEHVGYYDSAAEAWASYMDYVFSSPYPPKPGTGPTNFRPCPDIAGPHSIAQSAYLWGTPATRCDDYLSEDYGWATTTAISATEICPYGTGLNWRIVTGDGNYHNDGNSYIFHRTCDVSTPAVFPQQCGGVGNPIYPATGSKRQEEVDYVSASSLLRFVRTYTSDSASFRSQLSVPFVPPIAGAKSACRVAGSQLVDPHLSPLYCFEQINPVDIPSNAFFTDVTGAVEEFAWNGSTGVPILPYFSDQLSLTSDQKLFILKRPAEEKFFLFDLSGSLVEIIDRSGKFVIASYATSATPPTIAPAAGYMTSLADSFGRNLNFLHGPDGVLTSLIDPAGGVIKYSYASVSGATIVPSARTATPSSVVYQDGTSKQYLWDEPQLSVGTGPAISTSPGVNRLTGITDELGARFASFGYKYGAAVSTEHAGSVEKYSIVDGRYGGAGSIQVSQPNGSLMKQTYNVVNGLSRLTSQSQPAGSGCMASTSALTYDANGNKASEDDFNGGRVCYGYDLSRNLETARVEGLAGGASGAMCSWLVGSAASSVTLPSGSRKVSTVWHPDWRLEAQKAEPGKVTTSIYNGQPDPLNGGAVASCAPSSALLPDGKPIAVLCKQVEQATSDADGHLGLSAALKTDVASRVRSWTYNQYGQVLTETDPLGHVTTSAYYTGTSFTGADPNAVGHTMGDLQSVTNALGKVTLYTQYDKHGNVLQSSDANGVVTTNTYDLRQRLLSTSVGNGTSAQTTGYTYDAAGQLLKVTAPDASWIGYEYDPAHRLVATKDSLGNRIDYTLDNAGNRTAQTVRDPGGNLARTAAKSFDALGRLQQTTGRD